MRVFAVSDLHLASTLHKSMDVFGESWQNHWEIIREDWKKKVSPEDAVIVAGDISWGINYEEAQEDLREVCRMPGKKILLKGNHDYWHASLAKTKALLFNETYFIQNNAVEAGDYVFAGSRGWKQPGEEDFAPEDETLYKRELARLRLSLEAAKKTGKMIIGVSHFPPFLPTRKKSEFTDLYSEYGVKTVVYGHLHGLHLKGLGFDEIVVDDTRYILTSCDHLRFQLLEITPFVLD